MLSLSYAEEISWNVVIIECKSLSANWKQLSGYLGLSKDVIAAIEHDNPNNALNCLNEALSQWIKQSYNTEQFGLPSWRTLLKAVALIKPILFKALAYLHQGNDKCLCIVQGEHKELL